ncbi:GtrA family protein [Alkalimarinus alittae]|uniref:GtrA family protein n=1 Tax=Alkalimarinus alittae TaxID=2961619 RepID=A0ABY6MZ89_9ALTE|nr:GtrA family protein [Alkalimarinus alittae]UZE95125.1 GtrA family protein [Alkalimarinus alittae]
MKNQFIIFLMVGGTQYLLDVTAFSLFILFLTTEVSNILSRMLGACAGYVLNGAFTFKRGGGANIAFSSLLRFILVWCFMTLISTLAIKGIMSAFSGGWVYSVVIKVFVEMVLVTLSFGLQKFFVYR